MKASEATRSTTLPALDELIDRKFSAACEMFGELKMFAGTQPASAPGAQTGVPFGPITAFSDWLMRFRLKLPLCLLSVSTDTSCR